MGLPSSQGPWLPPGHGQLAWLPRSPSSNADSRSGSPSPPCHPSRAFPHLCFITGCVKVLLSWTLLNSAAAQQSQAVQAREDQSTEVPLG